MLMTRRYNIAKEQASWIEEVFLNNISSKENVCGIWKEKKVKLQDDTDVNGL